MLHPVTLLLLLPLLLLSSELSSDWDSVSFSPPELCA